MKYQVLLLVAILSIAFAPGEVYGSYVTKDLYAYWSFDQSTVTGDTIEDIAGNNDAKINGAPNIVPGKYMGAIEFDGQDDYVSLTILKGFGSHLGTFSLDFWLKTGDTPDWTTLFKTLTDGNSMGWAIDLNRSAKPGFALAKGVTHFYVRDKSGKHLPAEINAPIYDNKWHHIGWVVEDASSNTVKIYIDGKVQTVEYGDVKTPTEYADFQHPVYLGTANNRGNLERFAPAVVDEFRLYTRALTEGEIQQNMASGAAVESSGKLPVVWGELKAAK